MGPKGVPDTKTVGQLTVGHVNSTQLNSTQLNSTHCATSQKVLGSNTYDVIDFYSV
jgi:hypothetical protein